jgi:AcrR family transcriptional regulator
MPPTAAEAPRRPTPRGTPRDGADTKRRILTAAEEVVLRDGVAHLTLDAAAAQAGLSKGGVLYHFPSRDALVAGMVDKIIGDFEADIARHLPIDGSSEADIAGSFTRAYVRATVEPGDPDAPGASRQDRLGAALIAAAAAEPELLVPLQEAAGRWQARLVADGLDPVLATILRLACDGLWMCDLFGLAPPSGIRRKAVGAALLRMAQDTP